MSRITKPALTYRGKRVWLAVEAYRSAPVCMALVLQRDGAMADLLTVNLGSEIGNDTIMPLGCGFVDVNNHADAEELIRENGLGEPYMRFSEPVAVKSGFVEYPLYRFNTEKLKELDAVGFARYETEYEAAFSSIQQKKADALLGPIRPYEDQAEAKNLLGVGDYILYDVVNDGAGVLVGTITALDTGAGRATITERQRRGHPARHRALLRCQMAG